MSALGLDVEDSGSLARLFVRGFQPQPAQTSLVHGPAAKPACERTPQGCGRTNRRSSPRTQSQARPLLPGKAIESPGCAEQDQRRLPPALTGD